MQTRPMRAPVAFFVFNRPDCAKKVFDKIALAKPPKLYIICDGARKHILGEAEKVAACCALGQAVTWPCEVKTNFAGQNLGCKMRISSGIEWVFAQEEEAIFLEDDCDPDVSFFPFCEELLEKYRYEDKIGMISGMNYLKGKKFGPESYYFSHFFHIWGWASWRRAWRGYDVEIKNWSNFVKQGGLWHLHPISQQNFKQAFEATAQGAINTWDYQWVLHNWMHNRLAIAPASNLVTNFGSFSSREGAMQLWQFFQPPGGWPMNIPAEVMAFPLIHPETLVRLKAADALEEKYDFLNFTNKLKRWLPFLGTFKRILRRKFPYLLKI